MMTPKRHSFAVIGAGVSGATVASALARVGHLVHVFDKARGPGGRLATRRVEWVDHHGHAATTRLDHGALGFTAGNPAFRASVDMAVREGCLAEWMPRLAPGSLPLEEGAMLYVPTPDMPALSRHLLDGVPVSLSFAVDGLQHGPLGWEVRAGDLRHASSFDAVVLALPPAQAAPLLNPHRPEWAKHASATPMQPCWTLMGIADEPVPESAWDLARPPSGPLAWVSRNDARPGRAGVPGLAHWVAHAQPGWSRRHLEQPVTWVQQQLQAALAECLGRAIDWHHCTVHRWHYALPDAHGPAPAAPCWWDAAQGLGVCGDFLGNCGVEGAWLSAQALSAALLQTFSGGSDTPTARAVVEAAPAAAQRAPPRCAA